MAKQDSCTSLSTISAWCSCFTLSFTARLLFSFFPMTSIYYIPCPEEGEEEPSARDDVA